MAQVAVLNLVVVPVRCNLIPSLFPAEDLEAGFKPAGM